MLSWQHVTYKPSKLGLTVLVFGLRSEIIMRLVLAGLQFSACCGYDLCHPG